MKKKLWAGFAVGVMMLGMAGVAKAATLSITSDSTWKSFDSEVSGWTTSSFDDSSWRNASEGKLPTGYGNNDPFLALSVWDEPSGGPVSPSSGPVSAWFRKEINISAPITTATAFLAVDDFFNFYINGNLVGSNWNHPCAGLSFDIAPYLQTGSNVLAVYGNDGIGGWHWFSFTGTIATADPVPEPATMLIFGTGLAGLIGVRRKRV